MPLVSVRHAKLYSGLIGIVSAVAAAASAAEQRTGPSSAAIIQRSLAVNTADWKAQPQYAFQEVDVKEKVDPSGRTRVEQSKAFEVIMLDGTPYNRLIAIGNEPLGREQQYEEQVKLNREIKRREKESPVERQQRLSKYQTERSEEHMLMQQMIDAFHFRLSGEERVEGADCYVLDATPNPDYRPAIPRVKVLTGMKGRLWIEKSQYHWVKIEAEVINPVEFGLFVAKVKPGTRFELDQAPVGDVWLPKSFTQSVNATVLGMYTMRSEEEEHYSNYHLPMLGAAASFSSSRSSN